jgi:hypothetical protein
LAAVFVKNQKVQFQSNFIYKFSASDVTSFAPGLLTGVSISTLPTECVSCHRPIWQKTAHNAASPFKLEEYTFLPTPGIQSIPIIYHVCKTFAIEKKSKLRFKNLNFFVAHLHYGDSHSRLVRFKEHKLNFWLLKTPSLERF